MGETTVKLNATSQQQLDRLSKVINDFETSKKVFLKIHEEVNSCIYEHNNLLLSSEKSGLAKEIYKSSNRISYSLFGVMRLITKKTKKKDNLNSGIKDAFKLMAKHNDKIKGIADKDFKRLELIIEKLNNYIPSFIEDKVKCQAIVEEMRTLVNSSVN